MKKLTLIYWEVCPFCVKAKKYMDELFEENAAYKKIPLQMVEETKDKEYASRFAHELVPCYYWEDQKLAEGALTKDDIREVFEKVLAIKKAKE